MTQPAPVSLRATPTPEALKPLATTTMTITTGTQTITMGSTGTQTSPARGPISVRTPAMAPGRASATPRPATR